MSFSFGENLKITLFGQSHSAAIGVVIDGLPPGETIDLDEAGAFLARRAPGNSPLTTSRKEADRPVILSGLVGQKTCGAPLAAMIENADTRPDDYSELIDIPRPSHADYPAFQKYQGFNDVRGGGHFSGRMTAPLCFAGAVAMQILRKRGVTVGAHIASIGGIGDVPFDPVSVDEETIRAVQKRPFPVIDEEIGEAMKREILAAAGASDSVGGTIECCALGLPCGLGDPIFDGLESRLALVLFGIPAIKGVDFGAGFDAARMRGSEHNDPFYFDNGLVKTRTNHHGGILGGISTGMPLLLRTTVKPTPSIALPQQSVSLSKGCDTTLLIKGRHDPCIVLRAVPCVEAAVATVILDKMLYTK